MSENKTCPSFDEGDCITYPAVFGSKKCSEVSQNCKLLKVDFEKTNWKDFGEGNEQLRKD